MRSLLTFLTRVNGSIESQWDSPEIAVGLNPLVPVLTSKRPLYTNQSPMPKLPNGTVVGLGTTLKLITTFVFMITPRWYRVRVSNPVQGSSPLRPSIRRLEKPSSHPAS